VLCLFAAGAIGAATLACGGASTGARPGVRLIVSDETGGRVAIVDAQTKTMVDSFAVGKRPRGIRALRDGTHALVALSGSPIAGPGVDESKLPPPDRAADGIGVVDLAARRVVRVIPSGQDPETFALSDDERTIYISNEETAELSVVNVADGVTHGRVHVCEEPEGVTIRPGGREVYVTCEQVGAVVVVDTQTLAVLATIQTGARPRAIAFTPDGATAFVSSEIGSAVTVIDATTHQAAAPIALPASASAPTPPKPMGVVLSPDARSLFVSNGRARSVAVIDVAGRRLLRTIEDVGTRPWGIAVSPDGRTIYTANGPSGDISFIDAESGAITRIPVGGSPWGLAIAGAS
jgi:YVTN family beta-propeller protein